MVSREQTVSVASVRGAALRTPLVLGAGLAGSMTVLGAVLGSVAVTVLAGVAGGLVLAALALLSAGPRVAASEAGEGAVFGVGHLEPGRRLGLLSEMVAVVGVACLGVAVRFPQRWGLMAVAGGLALAASGVLAYSQRCRRRALRQLASGPRPVWRVLARLGRDRAFVYAGDARSGDPALFVVPLALVLGRPTPRPSEDLSPWVECEPAVLIGDPARSPWVVLATEEVLALPAAPATPEPAAPPAGDLQEILERSMAPLPGADTGGPVGGVLRPSPVVGVVAALLVFGSVTVLYLLGEFDGGVFGVPIPPAITGLLAMVLVLEALWHFHFRIRFEWGAGGVAYVDTFVRTRVRWRDILLIERRGPWLILETPDDALKVGLRRGGPPARGGREARAEALIQQLTRLRAAALASGAGDAPPMVAEQRRPWLLYALLTAPFLLAAVRDLAA